jgi:lipopolysaccharide/colanic/teichoic acid biosynthesis glycosyltransferase
MVILRLLDLRGTIHQTRSIAKLLHQRLRDTDEKGHLGPGRIGVMLAATDLTGTTVVAQQLMILAKKAGLRIEIEWFVYPDRSPGQDEHSQGERTQGDRTESEGTKQTAPRALEQLAMMVAPYPAWKRVLDVTGSVTGIILGSPLMLICAAIVRLTSAGPILYSQPRTGYLGQTFVIYKFRSMVHGADQMQGELQNLNERDGPAFKILNDPRTTWIGRIMRKTGLDELPQLFNVLRGDMALVGPRPLPVREAEQCEPWQKRRLDVRPGLTCFWQTAKSRQVSFIEWMRLDLKYARRLSLLLDAKLIIKTIAAVFLGRIGH